MWSVRKIAPHLGFVLTVDFGHGFRQDGSFLLAVSTKAVCSDVGKPDSVTEIPTGDIYKHAGQDWGTHFRINYDMVTQDALKCYTCLVSDPSSLFFILHFLCQRSHKLTCLEYCLLCSRRCPEITPWLALSCLNSGCLPTISRGQHSKHFWRMNSKCNQMAPAQTDTLISLSYQWHFREDGSSAPRGGMHECARIRCVCVCKTTPALASLTCEPTFRLTDEV